MNDLDETEEFKALAAEYALGLLSPAETAAFEDALSGDPDLRDLYALWAEDFAALTAGIDPVEPPKRVWQNIETTLFPANPATARTSFLQRLGIIPASLVGLAAAVAVLAFVDFGGLVNTPFRPAYQAQVAAADQSLIVLAGYDPAQGTLRVERSAGGARDGRVLELWVIAGDNPPVSLGVLPDAAQTDITIAPDLYAALEGGTLAISDEPPGGSPTGAPTGDVLAVGPLTLL